MDLGTPPEPGGEIFGSLMKNIVHKSNFMEIFLP